MRDGGGDGGCAGGGYVGDGDSLRRGQGGLLRRGTPAAGTEGFCSGDDVGNKGYVEDGDSTSPI